jgi:hypothetical protein
LFRAMTLVVNRGDIRRPLGLPANGLHDRLREWRARTISSLASRRNRSECRLPVCAHLCSPTLGRPPYGRSSRQPNKTRCL